MRSHAVTAQHAAIVIAAATLIDVARSHADRAPASVGKEVCSAAHKLRMLGPMKGVT